MLEFVKENKKWIYIIVIMIVLFIGASKLINSCSHSVVDNLMNEVETENIKKLSMNNEKEVEEVLIGIAKKNGDWSTYPLSKVFLRKYNGRNGIFSQYSFEEVSGGRLKEEYSKELYQQGLDNILNNDKLKKFSLGGVFSYRVGNGLTKLWENSVRIICIAYYINNKGELEDFSIIYDKQTVDENGEAIKEYDKELTVDNFKNIIWDILFFDGNLKYPYSEDLLDERGPIEITKQPCSKKLCDKVLNKDKNINRVYIDFFPQYNCGGGAIYFLNGITKEEAFNNREFYVACRTYSDGARPYDGDKPEHNYLYRLKFELDANNKLDDISLEYLYEISNEELLDKFHF